GKPRIGSTLERIQGPQLPFVPEGWPELENGPLAICAADGGRSEEVPGLIDQQPSGRSARSVSAARERMDDPEAPRAVSVGLQPVDDPQPVLPADRRHPVEVARVVEGQPGTGPGAVV